MGKRLKFSLFALPVIALSVLAFAGTASGGQLINPTWNGPDPQTANIPYLAWAGNQVKITKCFNEEFAGGPLDAAIINPFLRGKFRVEDWSGFELTGGNAGEGSVNTRQRTPDPQFLNTVDGDSTGQILLFDPRLGGPRLCFSAHVSSLKPGLAVIKLAVRPELVGLLPGLDVLAKHQFLVIWMRSQAPSIREVANADFPSISVGDPSGNGVFNLGDPFGANPGLVQIDVNGTVPMGNDFAGQWPGDSIQLPDAWAALAERYAFDDDAQAGGIPGSGSARWDIHDDKTPYANHAGANTCTPRAGTVDAVDNCLGGPQDGQFSYIGGYSQPSFGGGGGPNAAVGPFDQIRPLNSLLSDGKLDADDAPMPPLRVDVRIAAGGVGSLVKADKDNVYVRNSALPDATPHNLYAPFYEALIPAVLPSDNGQTSGVAGSFTNNFPGFQTNFYDYWDLAGTWSEDPLRNNPLVCRDSAGNPLPSPTTWDHVAVYTDEHGEAIVGFNPNTGFNFAVLNGACDLDLPANRSFSSTITATSIYPDQPVIWDQANKTSNALTKVVNIAASKTLNCVPKGPMSMFCVETVRDIRGQLQAGVDVRFTRSPRGDIFPDSTVFGGFNTSDQTVVSASADEVTVRTGPNGQAGVLIRETRNICIDVTAENLDTRQPTTPGFFNPGVFRQIYINPFAGTVLTACGDGTGGGGGGGTVVPPTVVPPTVVNAPVVTITPAAAPAASASVVSLAGNPVPSAAAPAKAQPKAKAPAIRKATLRTAQVLTIKGKRYLVVQLKSKLNSAKIRISLIGKNGKVQKVVVRKVATNRAVIVPNLRFGKAVKSLKIAVM